jgi:hypothetical protein
MTRKLSILTFTLAVLAAAVCTSCATINAKDSAVLKNGDGFLCMNIWVNEPGFTVSLFREHAAMASAVFEKLHPGNNLVMLPLKAGDYSFKYIYYLSNINAFVMRAMPLHINAGVINYTGRLKIGCDDSGGVFYTFADDAKNLEFARAEYPALFAKYQCRTQSMPSRKDGWRAESYWHD